MGGTVLPCLLPWGATAWGIGFKLCPALTQSLPHLSWQLSGPQLSEPLKQYPKLLHTSAVQWCLSVGGVGPSEFIGRVACDFMARQLSQTHSLLGATQQAIQMTAEQPPQAASGYRGS